MKFNLFEKAAKNNSSDFHTKYLLLLWQQFLTTQVLLNHFMNKQEHSMGTWHFLFMNNKAQLTTAFKQQI